MHIFPNIRGMKHGLEAGEVGQASIFREKFRRRHARFPFISPGETHTHNYMHSPMCVWGKAYTTTI